MSTKYVFLRGLQAVVWKRQSEKKNFLLKRNAKLECFASETSVKNSSSKLCAGETCLLPRIHTTMKTSMGISRNNESFPYIKSPF